MQREGNMHATFMTNACTGQTTGMQQVRRACIENATWMQREPLLQKVALAHTNTEINLTRACLISFILMLV
jgi:hypothetical protein